MNNLKLKLCKVCKQEKTIADNFYKAGRGYQTLCKPCHNTKRMKTYIKSPTGFDALSDDIKKAIIEDLANGLLCSVIAPKYNIKYFNLTNWKRKGLIKL